MMPAHHCPSHKPEEWAVSNGIKYAGVFCAVIGWWIWRRLRT